MRVDELRAAILAANPPLPPLELGLPDAHGCVLAADATAGIPVPPFLTCARDGYAVSLTGLTAGQALLISGSVAAGAEPGVGTRPGCAVRVATHAMAPPGTDAVVPLEWVTRAGPTTLVVNTVPAPGEFLTQPGAQVAAGARLLAAGTGLGAPQLALLAAAGQPTVAVRPRPRVIVLVIGDEVAAAGRAGVARIPDAAGPALAAAVRDSGSLAYRAGVVAASAAELTATLEDHLIRADAVIVSGGTGGGRGAEIRRALQGFGEVTFHDVAMVPGRVQGFGHIGSDPVPVFCLPGNAFGALISFEVFVRPALRRLRSAEPFLRPEVRAAVTTGWLSPNGVRQYVPGAVSRGEGHYRFRPLGAAGAVTSGLVGLAAADGLAIVAEEMTTVAEGQEVPVMLLERRIR